MIPARRCHRDRFAPVGWSGPAFTLIELIVVIVILSVVAAAVAPRFSGGDARRAEQAARNVRTLLSIAAHRDSLGSERLSLAYQQSSRTLTLETRRAAADGSRGWHADPLIAPAELGPLAIRSVSIDGRVLAEGDFRIEFPEHEPRGLIELTLERPGAAESWSIVLLPSSVQADMNPNGARQDLVRPIDLDAQGSGESPW
ncbi:MAG: prepilin-type N-terminal cleavage/methylation domain-containing protein [Phycisphaerae bacterium]|nr:prepilin-type N-terminal cleavage/methylation domain-containing protein [Phycisphaerae bacterium]